MVVEDGAVHFRGKRNGVARSGDLVLLNADHALETHQETPGISFAVAILAPMLRMHYAELDLCAAHRYVEIIAAPAAALAS